MSDMYLVQPISLTANKLHSTTAIDPTPDWIAGSYGINDEVLYPGRLGLPHKWISIVAENTATPGTDRLKWVDMGAGNRFAMFDAYSATQTQAPSPLIFEIDPGAVFTNVAMFNISGSSVRVEVISSAGVVIFDETKSLMTRKTSSWSEYFFNGFGARLTQAVFSALPFAVGARLRITVAAEEGEIVGIGRVVVGRQQVLGALQFGVEPFFTDYSIRKWDQDFGSYEWVVRDYSRGFRGSLVVDNSQLNRVWSTLISMRAVPTLYVGSDDARFSETLVTLGVMQDAPLSIDYHDQTLINFTVEGLT